MASCTWSIALNGSAKRGPGYEETASEGNQPDLLVYSVLGTGYWALLQRLPTIPRTDSINFPESYPTPSLNTVSTFSISSILFDGSPLITTRSACLPAAIVPIRSNSPKY